MRALRCLVLALLVGCSDVSVISDNVAPVATIELPDAGAMATVGEPVVLQGIVSDEATRAIELEVVWSSSRDGELATGAPDTDGRTRHTAEDLSPGLHILTLQVTDAQRAVGRDTVTVDVRDAVVGNRAPTAPVPAVSPEEPLPSDDLVCSIASPSTDEDGDELTYSLVFSLGGQDRADVSGVDATGILTVPAADTATGDEWRCTAVADDGEDEGDPGWVDTTVVCPEGSGAHEDCPGVSCLSVLQAGHSTGDGTYWITADTPGAFEVACDMTTDGGGWTGVTFPLADTRLSGTMNTVVAGTIEGIDPDHGPFSQDEDAGHAYQYDVDWSPGYDAFYLGADYLVASNACTGAGCACLTEVECTSEVQGDCFIQTDWAQGYNAAACGAFGDVAFGSPDDPGPTTSFAAHWGIRHSYTNLQTVGFPGGTTAYSVGAGASATSFRVAWGENGGQWEGWYPWYEGTVFLR